MASAGLVLAVSVSCGGLAPAQSTERLPTLTPFPWLTAPPAASPALASRPGLQTIFGTARPLRDGTPPCFADHYPCEVYDFALLREGLIEVAVAWTGSPRALLVQLYWAGEGLAHEDVAPRTGPSRIYFHRPRMEASNYRLHVVNLEPTRATPFTLTLNAPTAMLMIDP